MKITVDFQDEFDSSTTADKAKQLEIQVMDLTAVSLVRNLGHAIGQALKNPKEEVKS